MGVPLSHILEDIHTSPLNGRKIEALLLQLGYIAKLYQGKKMWQGQLEQDQLFKV